MDNVSWDLYEQMLESRGERSMPRMAYLDGVLELKTTGWDHERIRGVLSRLLETYMQEIGVTYGTYGNWTLRKPGIDPKKGTGIEADECYQLGRDQRESRWPDLAVEVIITSGSIDKLEAYRRIGVREVWVWEDGDVTIYVLRNKRYRASKISKVLPGSDRALIERLVQIPIASDAIAALRAELRRST